MLKVSPNLIVNPTKLLIKFTYTTFASYYILLLVEISCTSLTHPLTFSSNLFILVTHISPHKKKISNLMKTRGPSTISDLPDEIILDILSKLPIKTLSQCRYVCKTWQTRITHLVWLSYKLTNTVVVLV